MGRRLIPIVVVLVAAACSGGTSDTSETIASATPTSMSPTTTSSLSTTTSSSVATTTTTSTTEVLPPPTLVERGRTVLEVSDGVDSFHALNPVGEITSAELTGAGSFGTSYLLFGTTNTAGAYYDAGGFETRDFFENSRVWSSIDGVIWEGRAGPAATGSSDEAVNAVVEHEDGLLAAGHWRDSGSTLVDTGDFVFFATDPTDAAVWLSADGETWEFIDDPDLGGERGDSINDVVSFEGGYVAVGDSEMDDRANLRFDVDAAVWFSADGRDWGRVADPGDWEGGGLQRLNRVFDLGGTLVAVGEGPFQAGAWLSDDGMLWRSATDPTDALAISGSFVSDAALVDGTLLVGGGVSLRDNSRVPMVWLSLDGESWSGVELDGSGDIRAVVGVAGGFVLMNVDDTGMAHLLSTRDGLTFSTLDLPEPELRYEFAAGVHGAVLLGGFRSDGATTLEVFTLQRD